MNKNHFKGWKDVYGFTFRQTTKGLGFKLVTALVTLLIVGGIILLTILSAKPEEADKKSPIKEVYVVDDSGLLLTDYQGILQQIAETKFIETNFISITDSTREEIIQHAASSSDKSVAVMISKNGDGYEIEAVIPEGSSISEDNAEALLEVMVTCFESNKLSQAGLSNEQLTKAMMPVITSFSDIGEDTNMIAYMIKILAPMVFGLILYMMLLFHGQSVSKEVSTEKTSKLMETLLTSVHPYALITGKILAISSIAVVQFATWIVATIVGLYGGNAIAHVIYPEYQNSVLQMIDFIRDNIGETAFSLPAVLLAIVIFCMGFLFYCVLAGLAGCMVTRPEDVASTQGIFQLPIVISWLICYLAPVMEKEGVLQVARYVPFTAPFCVPVELITGSVGLLQGAISAVLLFVFSLLVIMCSARIYKGLVLYNGQKISFKIIGKVLKGGM